MSRLMNRFVGVLAVGAMVIGLGMRANAGPVLYSVEDSDVRNDNASSNNSPNGVNNRSDLLEVRNLVQSAGATTRKRMTYVKFDISGIDPSLFPTATICFSFAGGKSGAGVMSVFGLIDGVANPDSNFDESNWFSLHDAAGVPYTNNGQVIPTAPADGLSWNKLLGIKAGVNASDPNGDLGIDPTEASLLGVFNILGLSNDFESNTVDLPLGAFLGADTNGVVTFILADDRGGNPSTEWRIIPRESSAGASSLRLKFVPEPTSLALLALGGLLGLAIRRR